MKVGPEYNSLKIIIGLIIVLVHLILSFNFNFNFCNFFI